MILRCTYCGLFPEQPDQNMEQDKTLICSTCLDKSNTELETHIRGVLAEKKFKNIPDLDFITLNNEKIIELKT